MSIIAIIFIILILILLITFFLLYYFKLLTPYSPPSPNVDEMSNIFTIPSPWSNSYPVDGQDGKCNVYTFVSPYKYEPATISFNNLISCQNGCKNGDCMCNPMAFTAATCIDPDQIFAMKMHHVCGNDMIPLDVHYCLQQNGEKVIKGTVEEYFQTCNTESKNKTQGNTININGQTASTSNMCPGSLSLIVFNLDQGKIGPEIFSSAVCMRTPEYVYNNKVYSNLNVKYAECNMSDSYNGFPAQLFRIERADFSNNKFTINSIGQFARIKHRQTGYALSAEKNEPGSLLTLVPVSNVATSVNKQGYWWVLIQEISANNFYAPAQIIYVINPIGFPSTSNLNQLYDYLNKNNVLSIQQGNNGNLILDKYRYTTNLLDKVNLNKYNTQYLDYSIVPLITQNVSAYTFY